jgi:hypothetical protein
MSIWFFGRRRQGRRWLYSVSIPWNLLLALLLALASIAFIALHGWLKHC